MSAYPVQLSIVVPLYNEEECVERLYQTIRDEADKLGRTFEIIFVDDCSKDRTFEIAAGLARADKRLRVIRFRRNCGQTPAMACGFDHARGETIITMDGDLQNNPADMGKLLKKMDEGFEVVSGWRYKRQDAYWTRTFPSRIANRIISHFTGTHLHDYGCSLKAYKAALVKQLHFYSDMHRFFPAMVSALAGARTAEIPVDHRARTTGQSKYGLSRIFKVIADLVTIQLITQFSRKPIYWFGMFALPFLLLGGATLAASTFYYLDHTPDEFSVIIPGVAFLIISLFWHFITYGILAEYVVSTGDYNDSNVIAFRSTEIGGRNHE